MANQRNSEPWMALCATLGRSLCSASFISSQLLSKVKYFGTLAEHSWQKLRDEAPHLIAVNVILGNLSSWPNKSSGGPLTSCFVPGTLRRAP